MCSQVLLTFGAWRVFYVLVLQIKLAWLYLKVMRQFTKSGSFQPNVWAYFHTFNVVKRGVLSSENTPEHWLNMDCKHWQMLLTDGFTHVALTARVHPKMIIYSSLCCTWTPFVHLQHTQEECSHATTVNRDFQLVSVCTIVTSSFVVDHLKEEKEVLWIINIF